MRVICKEQHTPEWKAARHGKVTASAARFALARPGTKGRANYVEQLANDLEGMPDFSDEEDPPWFIDGRYYESWARGWYSFTYDNDVLETGFVVHDDYSWIGCSPDGLLHIEIPLEAGVTYIPKGGEGMVEIKYRKSLGTFKQHAALFANAQVIAQVQTQLFVTSFQWCDYVNYWRSDDHELEQGNVERIYRDDAYINNTLLPAFVGLWGAVQALLHEHRDQYQGGD